MKITGIDIGEYRQFKNIKFDFTYPEGHPKAGQPLEKVCFIGQSGTGKTTLLNIIWNLITPLQKWEQFNINQGYLALAKELNNSSPEILGDIAYTTRFGNQTVNFEGKVLLSLDTNKEHFSISLIDKYAINHIAEDYTGKLGIFIKESIARESDAFLFDQKDQPQTFSDLVKTDTQIDKEKAIYDNRINSAGLKKAISLGDMQSLSTWQYLLREIIDYDELSIRQIKKIIQDTPKSKLTDELQKWIAANPRFELAEKCLNPILDKLFLELDTEESSVPISIRIKHGIRINSSHLSTGTRQLLATAIPIYKFDTTDTVILFDEPERSLFPDIQRDLVSYYTSLAPNAQFFFATHSPIIASAFDPCERFILYFDENGEVGFHRGVAPEGDDPNDILRQDFDMAELMLQKGLDEYERYRQLAMQIRAETDEEKKNQLIVERLELGNRYNFAGQHAQSK